MEPGFKPSTRLDKDVIELEEAHEVIAEVDEVEARRLRRKVDFRLVPVLALLYLVSFIDRSNIGNARIAGLEASLGLSPSQYNMCLTIFFFPYALFEVPSNVVLKILRPSVWLTIIVLAWGTVMTLSGIVQNYSGLLAARFFLGVTEAGLFPAAGYILTTWYRRHEMQSRFAAFYCAATLAGAFSGLLAFALEKMDGIGGLEGWRWIFIVEGLATVVIGLILPFILPDSPDRAKFMTQQEKAFYIRRLQLDYNTGSTDSEGYKNKYLWQALKDWKIYLITIVFCGNSVPVYGFIYTLPTTIRDLGYSSANAQLLTIPVYTTALCTVLVTSYYADRWKTRSPFVIYPFTFSAICFVVLMALPKDRWPGARYSMLFGIAAGLYPSLCTSVAWNANNLSGSWKRAIGMALQTTLGNLGGAIGSNIYLAREAPHYWTGYGVSFAVLVSAVVAAIVLKLLLVRINKKRDMMSEEEVHRLYTDEQLTDMGDESPLFRYTT